MEIIQSVKKENKFKKWEQFKGPLGQHQCNNIYIIGVPKEEEKGVKDVFDEIMAENILNVKKEIDIQVQEVQRVPEKMNPKRSTPRYIIIKMAKVKKKILKGSREKQRVINKGHSKWLLADFSAETLQARRVWHDTFKMLKGKNLQHRMLYPASLSSRIEGEIKNFPNKQKLKLNTKLTLKAMLEGLF